MDNRFYKFRETYKEKICELFNISEEVLNSVEGVMFNYINHTAELRNRNYETVAKIKTDKPLTETLSYLVFEREVIGMENFHKFLKRIGSNEEKLEWVECWSDGNLKTAYHWNLDFSFDEADNFFELYYRNQEKK